MSPQSPFFHPAALLSSLIFHWDYGGVEPPPPPFSTWPLFLSRSLDLSLAEGALAECFNHSDPSCSQPSTCKVSPWLNAGGSDSKRLARTKGWLVSAFKKPVDAVAVIVS